MAQRDHGGVTAAREEPTVVGRVSLAHGANRQGIGYSYHWLIRALALIRKGEIDQARPWYDKAVASIEAQRKNRVEIEPTIETLRAEAAVLLGVAELPDDVFARP